MKKVFNFPLLFLFLINAILMPCCGNGKEPDSGELTQNPEPKEIYDLKISDMHVRDPFILVDRENQTYYMHVNGNKKVRVYKSKDLSTWKDMGIAFAPNSDFWGKSDFWAPDVYYYKSKYYLFITLSAPGTKRGTSILVADKPEGPFAPLINRAITPPEWMSLDGALYVDKDKTPWIIYCHEWLEVGDGEIIAQQLKEDLTETVGEPKVLFKASEAPWVGDISSGNITGKVTDAPFIHTLDNGQLIMLWSSFRKDGKYAIGQAISKSGNLLGPWVQEAEPLNDDDGGHAMLFNDIKGRLMISYHAPNSNTERPVIKQVYINNGKVVISD
jgi:beta-xylosidase